MKELLKMGVWIAGSIVCAAGGLALATILLEASLKTFITMIDTTRKFYCAYQNVEVIYREKAKR